MLSVLGSWYLVLGQETNEIVGLHIDRVRDCPKPDFDTESPASHFRTKHGGPSRSGRANHSLLIDGTAKLWDLPNLKTSLLDCSRPEGNEARDDSG